MAIDVYENTGPGEGLVRLHNAPEYRTMLLDEGIKPVFRVSNLDAEGTRQQLERYRAMGYFAAPCHAGFDFDEQGLYAIRDGGSLFYLFVSRSERDLADLVAVDAAQKTQTTEATKLEHALEVGRLLGYPACCTRFYASFTVNPHQTTFQLRTIQNTPGAVAPHVHPTLRLLGHFPCSLSCPVTSAKHTAIVGAMRRVLPEVAAWVEPAFRYPVLLMDHDGAVFDGVGDGNAVDYARVHHGTRGEGEPGSLKADLDRGNRAVVDGPWVRVFADDRLVGEHDVRGRTLLPLFVPMDGRPIGKRVRSVAVVDQTGLARYLAGDLLHLGYRSMLAVAPPPGSTEAFVAAAADRGIDTLVLTAPAPALAEAAAAAGISVIGAGIDGAVTLPAERHGFADGFERWSRGLDPTPATAPPPPPADHLEWPAEVIEDLLAGKRMSTEGPAPDRVPRTWIDAALGALGRLEDPPFARVEVVEEDRRTVLRCTRRAGGVVRIGVATLGPGWQISTDQPLGPDERKWQKALLGLLRRARHAD